MALLSTHSFINIHFLLFFQLTRYYVRYFQLCSIMMYHSINDQFSHNTENIRLICTANHLTDFYIIEALIFKGFRFTEWSILDKTEIYLVSILLFPGWIWTLERPFLYTPLKQKIQTRKNFISICFKSNI